MGLNATGRRRLAGIALLAAALGMLIVGLTVLSGRLSNLGFLAYWMVCISLTGLAMVVAILDARALRERTRREERALLETTLKEIVSDARRKPPRGGTGKNGGPRG